MGTSQAEGPSHKHAGSFQIPQLSKISLRRAPGSLVVQNFSGLCVSAADKQRCEYENVVGESWLPTPLIFAKNTNNKKSEELDVQARVPHQSTSGILDLTAQDGISPAKQRGWRYGMGPQGWLSWLSSEKGRQFGQPEQGER